MGKTNARRVGGRGGQLTLLGLFAIGQWTTTAHCSTQEDRVTIQRNDKLNARDSTSDG